MRLCFSNHKPARSIDVIDAWDDTSTLGKPKVMATHSNGYSHDPTSTTSTTIPHYDIDLDDDDVIAQSHHHHHGNVITNNSEMYAEIAPPAGVTSSRAAVTNQGYIFEDDLYGKGGGGFTHGHTRSHRGSHTNSHVLPGSLDRRRVSDLYSKPAKPKRKHAVSASSLGNASFDDPEFGGTIYEAAHQLGRDDDDVYGYTTSLA